MSGRAKVTVVGAGNVGATCAQVLATRDYADVVLVDIKEGLPQGKAIDIAQMGAVDRGDEHLRGVRRLERRRHYRRRAPRSRYEPR
jgi:malate dehydrogenase